MNSPLRIAPYPLETPLSDSIPIQLTGRFSQDIHIPSLMGTCYGNDEETLKGIWHTQQSLEFFESQSGIPPMLGIIMRVELFCRQDQATRETLHGLLAFNSRTEPLFYVPNARFDLSDKVSFTKKLLMQLGIPSSVVGNTHEKVRAANHIIIFSREDHQRNQMLGPRMVIPGAPPIEWERYVVKKLR